MDQFSLEFVQRERYCRLEAVGLQCVSRSVETLAVMEALIAVSVELTVYQALLALVVVVSVGLAAFVLDSFQDMDYRESH